MLGVDRSYALLTPEDAAAHVAHGIMVLDQCLYDGRNQPGNRVINLRNALNAGMTIRAYFSPNHNTADSLHLMRSGVPDDIWAALLDCAVDYEEANRGVDYESALQGVVALGKTRLMYTNNDTWMLDGNKPWPADTRCWNADWNNDITKLMPHPYGGLVEGDPRIIGRQYAGGTDEDLDIWLDVPKPPPHFGRFQTLVDLLDDEGNVVGHWPLTGTYDPPP